MRAFAVFCLTFFVFVGAGIVTVAAADDEPRFVAGEDYRVIDNPLPPTDSGKIRVTEFFLYSCPHCYNFEPVLQKWVATLGQDVTFKRSPVLFGGGSTTYARLFYTSKKLGIFERIHQDIYTAIHEERRLLQVRPAVEQFFEAHGVSPERFNRALASEAVKRGVIQAKKRMVRFGVRSVPSLAVAGKYWISGRSAGSIERMLKIAEYLVEKTRQARKSEDKVQKANVNA